MPALIKCSIEGENRKLDQRFQEIVSMGGWRLLQRGERFNPSVAPEHAVVGVAVWDNLGMEALAALAASSRKTKCVIVVFNIDDCSTAGELEAFMPGVAGVLQTPVVGEYLEGKLAGKLEGKAARDWMEAKAKDNP